MPPRKIAHSTPRGEGLIKQSTLDSVMAIRLLRFILYDDDSIIAAPRISSTLVMA